MLDYKEYVYAVYRERSFSKAAKKLYVSQPWLSAAIKKVEREIKLPLFDRSTNPVTLTEAGQYYIEQIERVMEIEREMQRRFAQLSTVSDTALSIGSSMFFCTYVLPTLLEDFRAQHPSTSVRLLEGSSQTLTEKLLNGQLDFLLEVENPNHKQIEAIPWAEEEIILAVPAHYQVNRGLAAYRYAFEELPRRGHPAARKPPVPLNAFKDEPFLLLNAENDSHRRCLKICEHAGFSPRVSLYLSQMMTAFYLVCEGRGIAFLRSMIPRFVSPTDGVVFYQLDDPLAVRTIYLSCMKQRMAPICQELIDFMGSKCILERISPLPYEEGGER